MNLLKKVDFPNIYNNFSNAEYLAQKLESKKNENITSVFLILNWPTEVKVTEFKKDNV